MIYFIILLLDKTLSKSNFKIAPDINEYLRNVFNIQTIQDIHSQILMIAQTLMVLDLLLKQSFLGIVFCVQKTPSRGKHS